MSKKGILISLLVLLVGLFFVCVIYVNIYYHSNDVSIYLENSENVKVIKEKEGYLFDGSGDSLFIFYPGAKVESISYAPLLNKLASRGIDTYLVNMPFRLAIFSSSKAKSIIKKHKYNTYYIGGHSLGGAVSSIYAYSSSEKFEYVILLGSYSTKNLCEKDIKPLFIYGSNDLVINKKKLEESKKLNRCYSEYKIEGGNHAFFGNYGKQKGDGEAGISNEEQINLTIDYILEKIF